MRTIRFVAWVVLGMSVCGLRAQTLKDAKKAFEASVVGRELYSRGFSYDPKTLWHWESGQLVEREPLAHMFAVLNISSVKFKGSKIELEGRETPSPKMGTKILADRDDQRVVIEVDLAGADMVSILPDLQGMLFFPDKHSASMDRWEKQPYWQPGVSPTSTELKACDCADNGTGGCSEKGAKVTMAGLKPPRITRQVQPVPMDESRDPEFHGQVQLGVQVDPSGHPKNIWILRPLGYGLEQNAAASVNQYVFTPAICHGKPVTVPIDLAIAFGRF